MNLEEQSATSEPFKPVMRLDEQSEESAMCQSGMKWSEGVIFLSITLKKKFH